MARPAPMPRDVVRLRLLTGLAVALAFPGSAVAVFGFGVDRGFAADVLSCVYGFGLCACFASSFLPFASLRGVSLHDRLGSGAVLFLGVSYATHLSWELGWLLFHESIAAHPDAPWAYPWWAYIDGGDARYRVAPPELLGMELLSAINGLVGGTALLRYLRSEGASRDALYVLFGSAVVHLYSASLYYLGELLGGLPNVDVRNPVNLYVKFGLANLPWVTMPFAVFAWVRGELRRAP